MDVFTAFSGILHADMYNVLVQVSSTAFMILALFTLFMFHGEEISEDVRTLEEIRTHVVRSWFKIEIVQEPSEEMDVRVALGTLRAIKNVHLTATRNFPKDTQMYKKSFMEYMDACQLFKKYERMAMAV